MMFAHFVKELENGQHCPNYEVRPFRERAERRIKLPKWWWLPISGKSLKTDNTAQVMIFSHFVKDLRNGFPTYYFQDCRSYSQLFFSYQLIFRTSRGTYFVRQKILLPILLLLDIKWLQPAFLFIPKLSKSYFFAKKDCMNFDMKIRGGWVALLAMTGLRTGFSPCFYLNLSYHWVWNFHKKLLLWKRYCCSFHRISTTCILRFWLNRCCREVLFPVIIQ